MLSGPMCVEVQDFFQWVYLSLEVDDQYSYYDGPKNAQAPYRASYKGQAGPNSGWTAQAEAEAEAHFISSG